MPRDAYGKDSLLPVGKDPLRRFKGEFARLFGPKRRGYGLNQSHKDSEGMHELHLSYLEPKARQAPNAADVRRPRKKGRRGRRR